MATRMVCASLGHTVQSLFTTQRSYASAVLGAVILSVCHARVL